VRFAQVIFRTCAEERGRVVFQMGTGDAGECRLLSLPPHPPPFFPPDALSPTPSERRLRRTRQLTPRLGAGSGSTAMQKLRIVTAGVGIAHAAVSRRPPISL
jgi:hypothetical protein